MAGRSISSKRLRLEPSIFLKGRSLISVTQAAIAALTSATLENRWWRRRARIQRSANSTPASTLALSRGL